MGTEDLFPGYRARRPPAAPALNPRDPPPNMGPSPCCRNDVKWPWFSELPGACAFHSLPKHDVFAIVTISVIGR